MSSRSPMISEINSRRITSLRFILMALVICIHNTLTAEGMEYLGVSFDEPFYSYWIKQVWSLGIAQAAVPLFFFFSAYLMRKKEDPYKVILKKKSVSLALPYFLWSFLYIMLFVVCQNLPFTKQYFLNPDNMVLPLSIKWWFGALFGIAREHPLVYQFWFLRDLMLLILLYPVIRFLVSKAFCVSILLSAAFYFSGIPNTIPGSVSVCFFVLGVASAEKDFDFFNFADKCKWPILILAFLGFNILTGLKLELLPVFFQLMVFCACLILLRLSKFFVAYERLWNLLKIFAPITFFMYALHEPIMMGLLKKTYIKIVTMQGFACLAEYVLVCFVGIFASTAIAILFRRLFPRLFAVLSGGRK